VEIHEILQIADAVTDFGTKRNFAGYSKHDGLNSPILHTLSFNNKWLRLIFIQAIMRFPVNLRPVFFTEKSRNPKGIALFAKGYLLLYKATKNERYKTLAEELLDWLMENHSNKNQQFSGYCWGYNFIWQSPFFYAPKFSPNLTVSVFPGEAFLLGYKLLQHEKYLEFAAGIAEYVLHDLPVLKETDTEKCLGYVSAEVSTQVININSMAAAFLAKLYVETKSETYKENAIKLMNFVVNNAIENNRWTYTTNIERSYVDNYHTGGIIDEILETMESLNSWNWKTILMNALNYYQKHLFTNEGAPRNRDNREYPYDIHGAAQGIITFAKMSRMNPEYIEFADKIYNWTIRKLYSGRGYFYYQKTRLYTKKFNLMRWCNAWMLYAMGELLLAKTMR
jgi:hypothetical protein